MRASVWRQEFVRHPSDDSLRYVKVENNGVTRYGCATFQVFQDTTSVLTIQYH